MKVKMMNVEKKTGERLLPFYLFIFNFVFGILLFKC